MDATLFPMSDMAMLCQLSGILSLRVAEDCEVHDDERGYLCGEICCKPPSARVAKMFSSCATSGVPVIGQLSRPKFSLLD